MDWVGRFWDGGGQPEQVTVRVEGQTVEIVRPSGEVVSWPVAEIQRGGTGLAGMGIRIELGDKLLIVRDEAVAGALGWKADRNPAYGIAGIVGLGVLILGLLVYAVWHWVAAGGAG